MDLKGKVQTGDWILPLGDHSFTGRAIDALTFGKVNHAVMVFSEDTVFETDGAWFKAKFNPLSVYADRDVILIRPLVYPPGAPVQELCRKYEGRPYAYWHIVTDALFSPLHPVIRRKLCSWLGSDYFMVCSELVARITFEASGYKPLKNFTGLEPEDLRVIALNNPADFQIIL